MTKHRSHHTRGALRPFRFYIASLGCPKNTVDSSGMAVLLQRAGYEPTLNPAEAQLVIVNTCGFIELAREESLETLQALAASLRPDQRLVAAGCWAQRDPEFLLDAVPELDALIGTRSWSGIVELAQRLMARREDDVLALIDAGPMALPEDAPAPGYVLSGRSAFLKIADGCSRHCAFCAIPNIKGASISRAPEAILEDARALQELGALEINLIAQDATFYGYDLGMADGLAALLERMVAEIPDVPWLRLLYAFPGFITPRLVDVMVEHAQILPYIDIPLQHAHPDVLRRMRRPPDMDAVRRTVATLRERMPGIALRTAFIVGYPGETEAEFMALLDFVEAMRFDRVGVFTYSQEVGTAAAALGDDVPPEVKQERYHAVMAAQQAISLRKNLSFVGQRLDVLLEGVGEGVTVARSYRDAPEIDGFVLIHEELEPHRIISVEIIDALEYDLIARPV